MGLWQRVREALRRPAGRPGEGVEVVARLLPSWLANKPLPPPHDYAKFAEDGARRNVIIASCIWSLVTSAAEPIFHAGRRQADGTLDPLPETDPLARLLAAPNPDASPYDFLEELLTQQQVAGQAYVHKVRDRSGIVVQLWPLRPDRVRVVPGPDGRVLAYRYEIGTVKRDLPAEDVLHIRLHPDPLDDYYGLSPIAVLARQGDLDNQAADYLRAFFLNNGAPAGLLKFKATRVDKPDRERIKGEWTQEHTGERGWHTVSVLDADVDYQEIGSRPDSLRMDGVFDETESRICAAFGVPAIIVGALIGLKKATYANYETAHKVLWSDTLAPLYRRNGVAFTRGLGREFGDDIVVEFDLGTVEALKEAKETARKFALDGWNAGLLTLDQALGLVGYPPVTGPEGEQRKSSRGEGSASPTAAGLGLLAAPAAAREEHAISAACACERHALTAEQKRLRAALRRRLEEYFRDQGRALVAHLDTGWEA